LPAQRDIRVAQQRQLLGHGRFPSVVLNLNPGGIAIVTVLVATCVLPAAATVMPR